MYLHKKKNVKSKNFSKDKYIRPENSRAIIQRAQINPASLTHMDVIMLQRTIGNQAVGRLVNEAAPYNGVIQRNITSQLTNESQEKAAGIVYDAIRKFPLVNLAELRDDVNLIFMDMPNSAPNTPYGVTKIFMGGTDIDEFSNFNTQDIEKFKGQDITIQIMINTQRFSMVPEKNKETNIGAAAATIAHEFAIHAAEYEEVIMMLKNNDDSEMIADYLTKGRISGLLEQNIQHASLAAGINPSFNAVVEILIKEMINKEEFDIANDIIDEVEADMRLHKGDEIFKDLYSEKKLKQSPYSEIEQLDIEKLRGIVESALDKAFGF